MDADRFYIGGDGSRRSGTATMPIMDPSMDEQVGTVALGSLPDVDRAVQAAATRRSKSSGDGRNPTASRSSNASARAPRRG
jgi:acyl-CoA reductase-like NAD-dependent aldehyde dehydrogenase